MPACTACVRVQGMPELAAATAAGCFLLHSWVDFDESCEAETVQVHTRAYAACANGRSIDFRFDWHNRSYWDSVKHWTSAKYIVRSVLSTLQGQ